MPKFDLDLQSQGNERKTNRISDTSYVRRRLAVAKLSVVGKKGQRGAAALNGGRAPHGVPRVRIEAYTVT